MPAAELATAADAVPFAATFSSEATFNYPSTCGTAPLSGSAVRWPSRATIILERFALRPTAQTICRLARRTRVAVVQARRLLAMMIKRGCTRTGVHGQLHRAQDANRCFEGSPSRCEVRAGEA